MPLLTALGLISLALAGISGWLVHGVTEHAGWFRDHGIPAPMRFKQLHLDWVMMGLIQLALQQAVPDMPASIRAAIAFGTVVNPLLFIPLAWGPQIKQNLVFRMIGITSFLSLSVGLPALAIWALTS